MHYKLLLISLLFVFFNLSVQSSDSPKNNRSYVKEYEGINDSLYYSYSYADFIALDKTDESYLEVALRTSVAAEKISLLDTATLILDRIKPLLLNSTDSLKISTYYLTRSKILLKKGNLSLSETYVLKAIEYALPFYGISLASAYNTYAAILFRKGDQEKSLQFLFKIDNIYARDSSLVIEYANSINNIGNIYQEIGNYSKALVFHRKASEIYRQNNKNAQQLISYNNIAVSHLKLKDFDSAIYYLQKIIKDPNNFSNSHINSKVYLNLGIISLDKKEYNEAISNLNTSYNISLRNGDKMGQLISLFNLGETYVSNRQFDKGEEVLNSALSLIQEMGTNRYFKEVHALLYELSVEKGDYKAALNYHKAYSDFQDSIYENVESRVFDMMELKYRSERESFKDSLKLVRKNNIIAVSEAKREQEQKSEQILRNLLIVCLLFAAGIIILILNKYKSQRKSNAIIDATNEELKKTLISKEEKELLLKEIHHRVKNNLQIISSLMRLQSNITVENSLKTNYQEMQGRINSMALVHEQLYGSTDFSLINVSDYTSVLIDRIQRGYSSVGVQINKRIEIEELSIETLIPLGLLLNELLTNCFKYAVHDAGGIVEIRLSSTSDGGRYLLINDNGPGVDNVDEVFNKGTFGGELFKTLIEQLDGKYKLSSENGFKVEVFF
tara:strand:+ start:3080 stop:5092 length:2013 start_codon:yes stop_codon:yes gene_type:complete